MALNQIINIILPWNIYRPKTGDVHFEFYSRKSDQKIVQDLLNHMISNGSLGSGTIPLVKTALSFQQEPSLWLNVCEQLLYFFQLIYELCSH